MASQITSLPVVYSTVYSGADQENMKAPRHWPLWREFTGDRWIPRTRGRYSENVSIWRHRYVRGTNTICGVWNKLCTINPNETYSSPYSFSLVFSCCARDNDWWRQLSCVNPDMTWYGAVKKLDRAQRFRTFLRWICFTEGRIRIPQIQLCHLATQQKISLQIYGHLLDTGIRG